MTALELIEKFKALSPEDQQKVRAFIDSPEFAEIRARAEERREHPDMKAIATQIMKEHDGLFRRLAEYERLHPPGPLPSKDGSAGTPIS